ncbi:MAG: DUF5946 family protein [Chloroflexi bacterium]|nr:DUF5946 family protein [Chloroflexota bacterium]MCC6893071.1 hypothetical protein [Anaerolineae bacterium]
MMETSLICPECGAAWDADMTCETTFHQMLYWEHENQANWVVHHLMVLCYYMQHPSLYSQEGVEVGKGLLTAFVKEGRSPAEMREANRDSVNSKNREWKITARPDNKGAYTNPVTWSMHAADVVRRGEAQYVESVREWAKSAYADLLATGNI